MYSILCLCIVYFNYVKCTLSICKLKYTLPMAVIIQNCRATYRDLLAAVQPEIEKRSKEF